MITLDQRILKEPAHSSVTDRTFGLLLGAIAALLGAWPLLRARPARLPLLAVAGALVLVAMAFPKGLGWLKTIWFAVTMRIAKVVTTVLLSVIFFVVVTPVALFFRLVGRDVMGRKFDQKLSSYWKMRPSQGDLAEGMKHQF